MGAHLELASHKENGNTFEPRHGTEPASELDELEFSEYQRDARFPGGWWIGVGIVTGATLIILAVLLA